MDSWFRKFVDYDITPANLARYTTGRYRLGLGYQHYWYLVPTVTESLTSPPSNFEGSGENNIVTFTIEAVLGTQEQR